MEKKGKMFVISIIFLFIGLAIGPITAQEIPSKENNNGTILIEYLVFKPDGSISTEVQRLSEEELNELLVILSDFMETIQSKTDREEVINYFKSLIEKSDYPILSILLKSLKDVEPALYRSRLFVISHGHGYKIHFLIKHKLKIYKLLTMWHYSSRGVIPGQTFIFRPYPFDIKVLSGPQIGMMTRFMGIYLHIGRRLPQQSYTFFIGIATNANGIRLPNIE
jgi:hypothetical protein